MIYLQGPASTWYRSLYESTIKNGIPIPCRQGLGLELSCPVHIEIPAADDNFAALGAAISQRRVPIQQRIGFSIAHGVQKLVGLPDSYLATKFPILLRYIRDNEETPYSRIGSYLREHLPSTITNGAPWISDVETKNGIVSSIDQLHFAISLLKAPETCTSRRAYIDFNEGYKPRCVSSWHFVLRDGALNMFQNVRSNDLLVGLPNDLVAARIAQIACSAVLGTKVGTLHHHASVVQIYQPDCAGVDGCREFSRVLFEDESQTAGLKFAHASKLAHAFIEHIEGNDYATVNSLSALERMRSGLSALLSSYIETDRAISEF